MAGCLGDSPLVVGVPFPDDGRPIDATSGRVVSHRGDRLDTAMGGRTGMIDRKPIEVVTDAPSEGDWNYDVRGGTGTGTINGSPALFASGTTHSCADRLYVPVNLDGASAANLYAFNNLYKDSTANCAEPSPADALCQASTNGHCPTSLWKGASAVKLAGRLDNGGVAVSLNGTRLYLNTTAGRFYEINATTGGTPAAAQTFDARAQVGGTVANFTNSTPFVDYVSNRIYTALDYSNGTRCRVYRFDPANLQTPIFVDLTTGCRTSVVFYGGFVYLGGADGRLWRVQDNGATLTVSGAPWPKGILTEGNFEGMNNNLTLSPIISAPTLDVQDGGQDYAFLTEGDALTATRLSDAATSGITIDGNGASEATSNPSSPAFDWTTHAVYAARERLVARTVFTPSSMSFSTLLSDTTVGAGDSSDPYSSAVVYQPVGTKYLYIGDGGGRLNRWDATTMARSSRAMFSLGNTSDIRSPIVIDYADGYIYFGADTGRIYQITQSQLN